MTPDRQKPAALVTGAARRIGRALALALAADGHPVAIHCHRARKEAEALAALIIADGGRAAVVSCDLADSRARDRLVEQAAAALGEPLAVLVNNASVIVRDDMLNATPESYQANMAVNLEAPFFLSQAFARHVLADPDRRGVIVHLVDQRVQRPTPQFMTYTLAKAGLWHLTRTMAQALAPRIRVNAIGPGPVLPSPYQKAEDFLAEAQATPLGEPVAPADLAAALRFLIAAEKVTGQMIAVDSGQHLAWATPDVAASGGEEHRSS